MKQLLFVYGTLMPGHAPACVSDLVARFEPVGRAAVRGYVYDLGHYPGLVLGDDGQVVGHLCELPNDDLLWRRLDAYEGFDPAAPAASLFRRVTAVATRLADGGRVDCQTYVYNRPVRPDRAIASGDWLNRHAAATPTAAATPAAAAAPNDERPMRRPIIGITADYRDDKPSRYDSAADYAKSVERAGGLPVILPFRTDLALVTEMADALDGVLFTGGNDLDPALYGEPWHPHAVPVDPVRQTFELALLAEVERRRMPALGVCLGCQLMNVHRGGSLVQFLPDVPRDDPLEHRHRGDDAYRHEVRVEPGTVLAAAVGRDRLTVNSRHKQAVRRVGRGLRPNAYSPDGLVEGVEDPTLPLFLAVQWHPENLTAAMPEHLAPFRLLVDRAAAAE
ncbi:MAG: Para-aminobenzoate synthase, amidotransferase component [uncultured Phycisphaerae bacterium]|uniref:Para-aminobenzoate synthase, amidotransferase component n=1 Tax=uncultured Phycisphaerae bacterium TaxID=904963 RepID=A0A6J4QKK9_9BACT|nr:MAG: Para-aminobenzoate synthase, amidotransferase component [uncultured Phycisphaerae bacterium]